MRKKTWIICVTATLLSSVAIAAVGCAKEEPHEHTYSAAWSFDATDHWHPATCSHDAKSNKSAHVFRDTVVPPTETTVGYTLHICACGYAYRTDAVAVSPSETEEYRYDSETHWHPSLTGNGLNIPERHSFTEERVDATCYLAGYVKHACKCGYWYATDRTEPVAHTYDDDAWGNDETVHWHPCVICGTRAETAAHDFTEIVVDPTCEDGGYTEFVCGGCGYSFRGRETAASHEYADTLEGDEYEHWHPAICEHEDERADVEEHVFLGKSNVCAVCGQTVSPRLAFRLSEDGTSYTVTGIGSFEGTDIAIPDTFREKPVTEIAAGAFREENITSVTFGSNLERIGREAFLGTQIPSAELPAGLKSIGAKAFEGCSITEISLGEGIESIGQAAFRGCTELGTVTFNGGEVEIPVFAFNGCTSLTEVGGTAAITAVGAQAFTGCTELATIDLSSCERVEFSAFGGCSSLAELDLAALAYAEEYAFSGCAVENVTLPALAYAPDFLFEGCTALESADLAAETVGVSAFESCTALESVTLNQIKVISESAFKGCSALTSLTCGDELLRVGKDAFTGSGLITAEESGQYAANVLIGAGEGSSVQVKAGTVGIADGAFRGNKTVSSVTLADTVRFVGVAAFRGCTALTEIDFKSVENIGADSFRESGLVTVTIPATVKSVGDSAFYDCESLTTVSVSAKTIGRFAFSYTGVDRTLSSPVKVRPDYAKLANVTLGAGVETVGSNAFQYCPVTQISLPEGVTSVGSYAFAQTDLTSVEISSSVTRIGDHAFYGCEALETATFATAAGWTAGSTELDLGTPAQNAVLLSSTYDDIAWTRR